MFANGTTVFPKTTWQPTLQNGSQNVVLELSGETRFDHIYLLSFEGDNNSNPDYYQLGTRGLRIYGSNDYKEWNELIETVPKTSIYKYNIMEGVWNYRYIWLFIPDKNITITEIAFVCDGSFLPVKVHSDNAADPQYSAELMIDEQDKLVIAPSYYDAAYFDEVYHPRNAWEIANGQLMYATVHPLFGTNLMALSVKLLGMTPFAWRIMGALFGIMMVPLMYLLVHLLFENEYLSAAGAFLLSFDFMHITTSRIGTLEPFSVFFIMAMFWFMIRYYYTSFYDTPLKKQLSILCICGVVMGIAIATKWTACYSAVGLAVILFTSLIQRTIEYRKAAQLLKTDQNLSDSDRQEAEMITSVYGRNMIITLLSCVVFFIIIPLIIYVVTYIPDHVWRNGTWSLANVWKQTQYILDYHSSLDSTHPFQSVWYEWLADLRPILYHTSTDAAGRYHAIACFSNPLLTWIGIPAILYTAIQAFYRKDGACWIITVGYLTALVPWIIVTRCVFAYHFYPTSIFVILAITVMIRDCLSLSENARYFIIGVLAVYLVLFIIFMPATCGFGTTADYINSLEWLPRWNLG